MAPESLCTYQFFRNSAFPQAVEHSGLLCFSVFPRSQRSIQKFDKTIRLSLQTCELLIICTQQLQLYLSWEPPLYSISDKAIKFLTACNELVSASVWLRPSIMTWLEPSTISGGTESPSGPVSTSLPDPVRSSFCAPCLPCSEILPTFRCYLHQHHTFYSPPLPVENPGDKISVGDLKTEKIFPSTFFILKLLCPPLAEKALRLATKVASIALTPRVASFNLTPHSLSSHRS